MSPGGESGSPASVSWERKAAEVAQLVDGLGKGIDPGILDTVVGLQLSGIHTIGSCEGHVHWGVGAPWVALSAPDDEQLRRWEAQRREALAEAEDLAASGAASEKVGDAHRRMHEARLASKAVHLRASETALALLEQFYSHRHVTADRRLILTMTWNGGARLQSQGAVFQEVLADDQRARKLVGYQQEMDDFTAFLKNTMIGGTGR